MHEHQEIKVFHNIPRNCENEVNVFLLELGKRVISVQSSYNSIYDSMNFVIVYWC